MSTPIRDIYGNITGAEFCLRCARRHLGNLRAAIRRGASSRDVRNQGREVRLLLRAARSHLRRFYVIAARERVHGKGALR